MQRVLVWVCLQQNIFVQFAILLTPKLQLIKPHKRSYGLCAMKSKNPNKLLKATVILGYKRQLTKEARARNKLLNIANHVVFA